MKKSGAVNREYHEAVVKDANEIAMALNKDNDRLRLDVVAKDNHIADLNAKIQLLEQDLEKTQEYREELQSRLDEVSRRANGRMCVLHAIQSMVEASP